MPYLTLSFSSGSPIIDLSVGVSAPRQQALLKSGTPIPPAVPVRGLIDTGATLTCIDPWIVDSLQLMATGSAAIYTPSTGTAHHQANEYDVHITILHPELTYSFHALPVIESSVKHQGFDVLIGRDILSRCLLVYDGQNNSFSLSF